MALPENISTLKHLRYLEISRVCRKKRFPSSFCRLYNLQILYASRCLFESLPVGFNNLINLQKFEAEVETHTLDVDAVYWGKTLLVLNNITIRDLIIDDIGSIGKDHAEKLGNIWKMKYPSCLTLRWSLLRSQEHIGIEILQALNPSTNTSLQSLHLKGYPGEYLLWDSHPCNLPTSVSPLFRGSDRPEENIYQNEQPVMIFGSNNGRTGSIFPSLTELQIKGSEQLSSLEQFLQPYCVPAIKKIGVANCPRLSLQSSKFGDLSCLQELYVCDCPNIISGGLFAPYLKQLTLEESRNLGGNLTSILKLEVWSLPALLHLRIRGFSSLTFIRIDNLSHQCGNNSNAGSLSLLTDLTIHTCNRLKNIDGLLSHDLPAVKSISIRGCPELKSLPGERFGSFSSLRDLEIVNCPCLNWHSGMVLPLSLQSLQLQRCGEISSWFPSCLENLTSLKTLDIKGCEHIVSIPHLWRRNLPLLMSLFIVECPDLESIGGRNAVAHINFVYIMGCTKLKEIDQPYIVSKRQ